MRNADTTGLTSSLDRAAGQISRFALSASASIGRAGRSFRQLSRDVHDSVLDSVLLRERLPFTLPSGSGPGRTGLGRIGRQFVTVERTGTTLTSGFLAGFTALKRIETDAFAQGLQLANVTAAGMTNAFSTFFFDVMDRKIKNFGDLMTSLKSLVRTVVNAIVQELARIAAIQFIGGLFSTFGVPIPALAAGGIVSSPTIALIGEAGPEAVMPLDRPAPAQPVSGPVTVNVFGAPPGSQPQVTTRRIFDQLVVDIVLRKLQADMAFRNAVGAA